MYNCNSKRNSDKDFIGDWSNGMIGVSKTFGGSSILSSPANRIPESCMTSVVFRFFVLCRNRGRSRLFLLLISKMRYIDKKHRAIYNIIAKIERKIRVRKGKEAEN